MTSDFGSTTGTREAPLSPETTIELLELAKGGDPQALDRLLERCVPALRRWAHGRLPASARGMNDTADIVQDTIISAMRRLEAFESRHQGALQAYLRQAVMNRIRDIIRQHKRRPEISGLSEGIEDEATSPLEAAIGAENLERYEAALQRLKPADREAIIGRLEMLYGYDELATVLGRPSASAARMAVTRAMKRLAEEMHHV
jgi:RNA polymerase sigma-70 factor (ECF subfamily)